jgi:hypothetical protein
MKKLVFALVFVFFLVLVNGVDAGRGCCVDTITGSCSVEGSEGACSGDWTEGAFVSNTECDVVDVEVNGESVLNACQIGCSEINGNAVGRSNYPKIKHVIEKQVAGNNLLSENFDAGRACSSVYTDRIGCIVDDFCEMKTAGECNLMGTGDTSIVNQGECDVFNSDNPVFGCCVEDCRVKDRNQCRTSTGELGLFEDRACSEIDSCEASCSGSRFECRGNSLFEVSDCGWEELVDECQGKICNANSGSCDIVKNCIDVERLHKDDWCDKPIENDGPGDIHYVMTCLDGEDKVKQRCDEFRGEICVENEDGASCEINRWKDCKDRGSGCKDGIYENHCKFVGGECLPRHPPGFRFWRCNEVSDEKCFRSGPWEGIATGRYDNFMCSVETSELGCELSGDCESIPIVDSEDEDSEEETSVENELPNDCVLIEDVDPIGCCIFSSIGSSGTEVEARTMKESLCTSSNGFEHVFFDGKVCFDSTEVTGVGPEGLEVYISETHIVDYVKEPVNCEENVDIGGGDDYYTIRSDSYCSCDNQICFRGGGGVCKTS